MDPQLVHSTHFPAVYRFFYYRNVDNEEIEDLCQETFYRFFLKYSPQQLNPTQIIKILYAIARNVWREWLRQTTSTRTEELLDDDGAYGATAEAFSEEELESNMWETERPALLKAIEQLNPTLRSVLTLRFIEGKTRAEIAALLGTKEKYVHIYQQRGIKALQKVLAKSAVSPLTHT